MKISSSSPNHQGGVEMLEEQWEKRFIEYLSLMEHDDASHDLGHFSRVYQTAREIASGQLVDLMVILAAAYFHDIVSLPKNHPDNKMSSRYAAVRAKEILRELDFPEDKLEAVGHAIEAHSFSAQIEPRTLEAKIIQDADRMESLGALGIMRTFYVTGRIGRAPFDPEDLYAKRRPLDDKLFGLDHFYVKLFKLPALLQTEGGRRLASRRADFLHYFVKELEGDIERGSGGALLVTAVCAQAGKEGFPLFDSANSAIDRLAEVGEIYPKFLSAFLLQFQEEVGKLVLK